MISNSLIATLAAMSMASGFIVDVEGMAKNVVLLGNSEEGLSCAPETLLYARVAGKNPAAISDISGVAFYTRYGCIYVSQSDGNVITKLVV